MLLTDSDFLTTDMLAALEPEIREVAEAQDISLEGDNSIIRAAWDECADTLLEHMDSFGGYLNLSGMGGHVGTLVSHGLGVRRPRVFLSQIVATEAHYANRVPVLQRWMLYRALYLLYRTASQRTVHDRYQAKADEYERESKRHWRSLWAKGLPVVVQPLAAPGAIHEFNSGEWGDANVTAVAGGSGDASAAYAIAITWVGGSRTENNESGPSAPIALNVSANQVIRIDISSLNPPDGTSAANAGATFADGILSPLAASGWNIYVGALGGTLKRQNASPIPIATKTYTFAGAPATTGAVLTAGQLPDANFTFSRVLHRA